MCGEGGREKGSDTFWVGGEYKPAYAWALVLLAAAVRKSFDARFLALCKKVGGTYIAASLKSVLKIFENDQGCAFQSTRLGILFASVCLCMSSN